MSHSKLPLIFWVSLVVIVIADQATKFWAEQQGMVIYNSGISLGLFTLVPNILLSLGLVFLLVGVGIVFRSIWSQIPLAGGLFFGGGISNLIDRGIIGRVRDWLPIPLITIHNNIADYAIGLGLISMIVVTLRQAYLEEVHQDMMTAKQIVEEDEA